MLDINPQSAGNSFRRARVGLLNALIGQVVEIQGHCTVLDIGGTGVFWETWKDLIDWRVVRICCLNLPDGDRRLVPGNRVTMLDGDARDMAGIDNLSFDVCFSNSVIEHVGGWSEMAEMAGEIARVAQRYLVQTPNFWFPVEPHARTPFLHWLPEPVAYRMLMARRCGFWPRQLTVGDAVRTVQSARLIDARQLAALFPDAAIRRERFCGLTKSLIAIRG